MPQSIQDRRRKKAEYQARYRAEQPEKVREQKSRYGKAKGRATWNAWKEKNAEKHRAYFQAYNRAYYRKNLPERLLANAQARALARGVPFALQVADVVIPEFCPVLGVRLEVTHGNHGFQKASPSIDRIIPELGYVPGNVAVISMRANSLKRDGTLEEFRKLVAWLETK